MSHRGYTLRRENGGWGVYARDTGEPVRVNGRLQTGLPHETAAELAEALQALIQPGPATAPPSTPKTGLSG
ncbi:hypothetical protein [Methylobacterium sp. JK268]